MSLSFTDTTWRSNVGIPRNGAVAENHARTQGESILLDVIELKVPQFSKEEGAEEGAILCGVVLWAEGFLHHAWEGVMKQCEKGWGLFYLRPKGNVVYCSLLLDITFSKHTYKQLSLLFWRVCLCCWQLLRSWANYLLLCLDWICYI